MQQKSKKTKTPQGIASGERLKSLRKSHNLTQQGLADLIYEDTGRKYNRAHIAGWECGFYGMKKDTLRYLCDFYDVDEEYILGIDVLKKREEALSSLRPLKASKLPYLDGEPIFCQKKSSVDGDYISGEWAIVDTQYDTLLFTEKSISFDVASNNYNLYYRPVPLCYSPVECTKLLNTNEIKRIGRVWVEIITTNDMIRKHCDYGEYIKGENIIKLNNGIVLNMNHYGKAFICYKEKPQLINNEIFQGLA